MTTRRPEHTSPRASAGTPATGVPQGERGRDEPESRSKRIERVSPEGRPAHPEYDTGNIRNLLIGAVALVVLLSVATAVFAGLAAGAVVLVFGLGVAILMNPAIWAASLRAKERSRLETPKDVPS